MSGLFLTLIVIMALVLTAIVLIQNPKGGGLASGLTNVNYVSDHKTTTDVLEKGTFILAGTLLLLCLIYNIAFKSNAPSEENNNNIQITAPATKTVPSTVVAPVTSAPVTDTSK